VSDPVVDYKESVGDRSNVLCSSKFPNSQNRIITQAEPLHPELTQELANNKVTNWNQEARANYIATNYSWNITEARNIWTISREDGCVLVDTTSNITGLNEVKESIIQAFGMTVRHGVLAEGNKLY
jgi:elongation factor 2